MWLYWEAVVCSRTSLTKMHGCPKCGVALQRRNRVKNTIEAGLSFADRYPELASEWDYEKNEIDPNKVTSRSGKKAYWICKTCGYKWCTPISNRTAGHGCRICSAKAGALRRYSKGKR